MFFKVILFLSMCTFGMIKSQDVFIRTLDELKNFDVEVNGDLLFDSTSNTNDEVAHQQTETLRLHKDVEGILHYSIGARVPSK